MADRFPAVTTSWVISEGRWQRADNRVDVVHYTNATLFVDDGGVIDGRANGLSQTEVDELKARYPNDVIEVSEGEFRIPVVPVGTVVDITPQKKDTTPSAKPIGKPRRATRRRT
jgi:hypothetical protein